MSSTVAYSDAHITGFFGVAIDGNGKTPSSNAGEESDGEASFGTTAGTVRSDEGLRGELLPLPEVITATPSVDGERLSVIVTDGLRGRSGRDNMTDSWLLVLLIFCFDDSGMVTGRFTGFDGTGFTGTGSEKSTIS
jgi:hypothetical protein